MRNRIVREETCFDCNKQITVMEYEPYNASAYIPVTVINGLVNNKVAVCHRCFNTRDYTFTELGWTRRVPTHAEQGSTLTPVIAILTVFSVGAVLIAQSGLVNALLARFAQVVQ